METTRAIVAPRPGGPEVLVTAELPLPPPGPGEVRVRHTAVGLNFIDLYQRSGLYPLAAPHVPGCEAAGVVEAVGPGVTSMRTGQRVAYALREPGAYAQRRNVAADRLVIVPETLGDEQAACALLKGMTAEYLVQRVHAVQPGQLVVIHAAAGATGGLVCQWAASLGARVVGVVSTAAKAERARALGCSEVLIGTDALPEAVRSLTGGRGADVVYDSVGRDTWQASLESLAVRGQLVLFGQASGPVPPIDPALLARGSLRLTRPSLFHFIATHDELQASAAAVFERIADGRLRLPVERRYRLDEAGRAHAELESRATTGAGVLIPSAEV